MSCELCKIYLHDYFEQEFEEDIMKEFIHKERLKKHIHTFIPVLMRLFRCVEKKDYEIAKFNMENYCSFIRKPANLREVYDIYFMFLTKNERLTQELKEAEAEIHSLGLLKYKTREKNDYNQPRKWLSYIISSLVEDMNKLHNDHSKNTPFYRLNLDAGMPGRPSTAKKDKKRNIENV